MKLVIILALVAVAVARPDDGGTYDSKYDNFNVDELVGNARLLKSYAHCFLDDGKCTPEGNDFKSKYSVAFIFLDFIVVVIEDPSAFSQI